MLSISSLRNSAKDEREREMESFLMEGGEGFPDFSDGNFLDMSIDFDDLFIGIKDGDVLPDLEVDLAEFSASGGEESESVSGGKVAGGKEEIVSKREESVSRNVNPLGVKGRKSSAQSKNNSKGKRKVKVDWTPELHKRFVQAVEQIGVDKAVPSRILEIMGIDCLTRHNIASHLQKYRSHRKHLLAREAEAVTWSQKRQMYGGVGKNMSPWLAPTMAFPPTPMTSLPQHFRPLHVWGHPFVDQRLMPVWPKHLALPLQLPLPPLRAAWGPTPHPPPVRPPPDPSFWHSHHQRVPNSLTPGTPYFPPPLATTRFQSPMVPGIPPPPPPHAMYRVDPPGIGVPTRPSTGPQHHPPFDFYPLKESIDSAIGDVLSKPWLPLPLGLKPPSLDGVLVELQRQGISKIPPACA
ncbi:transcription activator GLK1-like isoform X1 [Actinidia eriantha]|uniref:transcription activator GLK1-like isoform X1 n=1 Tax=Actinidia eriantha TaxID=165200 RepID=UPI00258FFC94|nr:transcription activator GLK1-like isoform X1 [Actinidia eriantha]